MQILMILINNLMLILGNDRGNLDLTGGDPGGADPGNVPSDPAVPAADPADPANGADPANANAGGEGSIFGDLDADIKDDPSLKVFLQDGKVNWGNLAKSYVHGQRKMGEKGVLIPGEHASDEDLTNFYNKLRDPDLDKYEVKNNLPEGTEENAEMLTNFKSLAHKAGLAPKQAQTILDWYNTNSIEGQKQVDTQREASYAKEIEGLKTEWGEGTDREMALARRALKEFASEDQLTMLKETGLSSNVTLIRLFNKIGKSLTAEDKFQNESHRAFGMTPDDAQKKINEMYAEGEKGAYLDGMHPNHKFAVEEMQKLLQIQTTASQG